MSLHIHYHSDCDSFAGCEQMLVVLLRSAQQCRDVEASFSYRHSTTYAEVAQRRLPRGIPIEALALPDANAVRSGLGGSVHGRLLWTLKAITYALPLRQVFQVFDVVQLWFLFRRTRPTIVHINNGGFPGAASCNAAAVAARLAGVPVVVYVVNNIASGYRSPLRWADFPLDRIAARCVTRFVTGSEAAAEALRDVLKVDDERVISIHNGVIVSTPDMSPVQLRASLGLHHDELIIASIARLERRKGHRHLLEAFSQLIAGRSETPAVLILEGTGPEEAALRRQVEDMGLGVSVQFVGHMPNIWNLLAAADAVVLPSIGLEDFPNVVLEAMAMAKPVIASAVAGIPEQIADGETGLLVDPGDVGALSRALKTIVTDVGARKRMGDAALARYNQMFTPDVAARRYRELYLELIAARRSS